MFRDFWYHKRSIFGSSDQKRKGEKKGNSMNLLVHWQSETHETKPEENEVLSVHNTMRATELLTNRVSSHVSMCIRYLAHKCHRCHRLTACTGAQSCSAAFLGISWPATRGAWARRSRASLPRSRRRRRSPGGDRSACFSPHTPPHPGSPETAVEIK